MANKGEGYGERFASSFGIAEVSTTTRYVVAKAFREIRLYYLATAKECSALEACSDFHAGCSPRDDGHRVFSFPALVARTPAL